MIEIVIHRVGFDRIEEEKLDLFNIPEYMPSPTEIEIAVNK